MADKEKVSVGLSRGAASTGEFVVEVGGEEKRFRPGEDQEVSAEQYEELKQYKTDSGQQVLVKRGGVS